MNEKIKDYPKTDLFEVVDTIGVPHTFMIGLRHIAEAQNHSGQLNEEVMRKVNCCHPQCQLSYDQNEQALLVKVKKKDDELIRAYLLSIKDRCEADGFAGFTLLDGTNGQT